MERFIKYLVISFSLVFIITMVGVFSSNAQIGFWAWIAFLVVGTLFISIGSFLGSLFLDFVRPDAYFTSGAMDAFYKRIFWTVGPQFIGGFIGFMACNGFLINVLGLTQFR
ncbi:hypothetical protein L1D40_13185 [Shewanella insulae]|uniref:hypothetical protein n=1 Tax=Shewanella insulae TaxID=2681496 RepID=UPI001EFD115B|nr:hypothetical protein [Shewanella insulae]MCG9756163.1 hypothetical protein [Shewanella insulae]